jgi:hypothetical protein
MEEYIKSLEELNESLKALDKVLSDLIDNS